MAGPVIPLRLVLVSLRVGERGPLAEALAKTQLPNDDVDEPRHLFFRFDTSDGMPVGFGGLEIHASDALLRSVVTLPPVRRRGIGRAIVAALEEEAARHGCRAIFLLTIGASRFFAGLGYEKCRRMNVPASIRATRQFAKLCPDSAEAMKKHISPAA